MAKTYFRNVPDFNMLADWKEKRISLSISESKISLRE